MIVLDKMFAGKQVDLAIGAIDDGIDLKTFIAISQAIGQTLCSSKCTRDCS